MLIGSSYIHIFTSPIRLTISIPAYIPLSLSLSLSLLLFLSKAIAKANMNNKIYPR